MPVQRLIRGPAIFWWTRTTAGLAIFSVLLAALAGIACGGDGPEPGTTSTSIVAVTASVAATEQPQTPSPPPTSTAATTATPEATVPLTFRDFVREEIVPALAQEKLDFFEERARTQRVVCTPENTPPRALGGPACETVGQEFDGFPVGHWRSEGSIVPLQDAIALIERLFAQEATGASDPYGDALPQVYAIGGGPMSPPPEGEQRYASVVTALIERPQDFAGEGPLRVVLVLNWAEENGGFSFVHVLSAFVFAEEFLEPAEAALGWMSSWEHFP